MGNISKIKIFFSSVMARSRGYKILSNIIAIQLTLTIHIFTRFGQNSHRLIIILYMGGKVAYVALSCFFVVKKLKENIKKNIIFSF